MKFHAILSRTPPHPWPPIKANRYASRLLQFYIQSPFFLLADHPLRRVLISVGTDKSAPKPIGQDIQLVHDLIVGLANLDDFFGGGILRVRWDKI